MSAMPARPSLSIPADWSEVTPAWMTAALAERFPGAEVADVELVTRDDGTNRRARFRLTYAGGTGPEVVFAKAEGEHRLVHQRNGNLFNEAELLASGVPLPVDHPTPYRVLIDRPALDHLVLMEDVTQRGGDPRDGTRPMTVDQVARGLMGLARLHSRYWGFSPTTEPGLGWVQTWQATEGFASGLARRIPTGLDRGGDQLPPEVAALDGERIVDLWARYVDSLDRPPVTLLHADAHIGNTYVLPDGDVGFLDWQVARRGRWSQDVGCFLIGSLVVDDRRRHERELLAAYRDALEVPEAQRPEPEAAWDEYRASAAYGLAIWSSTLGTDGYQRRDVSLALAQRYAVAFDDLDAAAALGR
jgi:hypothetical protein